MGEALGKVENQINIGGLIVWRGIFYYWLLIRSCYGLVTDIKAVGVIWIPVFVIGIQVTGVV